MVISSRTPEGEPNRCPVCGAFLRVEPSRPAGDAPCPKCGHLLWFLRSEVVPAPDDFPFRLVAALGRNHGERWSAVDAEGLPAVVYIYPLWRESEADIRSRVEPLLQLRHPHLLEVRAYRLLPGRLIVVEEAAEGSLRERLKACRRVGLPGVPADELVRYVGEAAGALDYLHGRGVLHRDIKPDNLRLKDGRVKVADYRASVARRPDGVSDSGTPAYMAPERWRGETGERSDQYSLAVSYVELRLGRRPFAETDFAAVALAHLQHDPDLGDLPAPEQGVLLRALAKDPAQRHPSCREFAEALAAAV
jgi:serine/threonine protein kinase